MILSIRYPSPLIMQHPVKAHTLSHTHAAMTPVVVFSAGILPQKLAVFVDVSAEQQWARHSVHC